MHKFLEEHNLELLNNYLSKIIDKNDGMLFINDCVESGFVDGVDSAVKYVNKTFDTNLNHNTYLDQAEDYSEFYNFKKAVLEKNIEKATKYAYNILEYTPNKIEDAVDLLIDNNMPEPVEGLGNTGLEYYYHNSPDGAAKKIMLLMMQGENIEAVQKILSGDVRPNLNFRDSTGATCLMIAINFEYKKHVELFIDNGSDINATIEIRQYKDELKTPITLALEKGFTEIGELLIDKGANVHKIDGALCPLELGLYITDKVPRLEAFVDKIMSKYDTKFIDEKGASTLIKFCRHFNNNIYDSYFDKLLETQDLNHKDNKEFTPLIYSAVNDNCIAFQKLLIKGANMESTIKLSKIKANIKEDEADRELTIKEVAMYFNAKKVSEIIVAYENSNKNIEVMQKDLEEKAKKLKQYKL